MQPSVNDARLHPLRITGNGGCVPHKRCRSCNVTKPYDDFPPSNNLVHTRSPTCHACTTSKKNLARRVGRSLAQLRLRGLTPDAYLAMRAAQEDCCAICKKHESSLHHMRGTWKRLVIDHDHSTGMVRGLLCNSCNKAIGLFHDSIPTLRNAIRYLQGHQSTKKGQGGQIELFT